MEGSPFATVEEYRLDTGDNASGAERVAAELSRQSAKLRALLGIPRTRALYGDAAELARELVTDAVRKKLVVPAVEALGEVPGVSQAGFSANGFQGSWTFQNPSGSAYFDRSTLAALRRCLGRGARVGTVAPYYGGSR